jgi:hypothetical protein
MQTSGVGASHSSILIVQMSFFVILNALLTHLFTTDIDLSAGKLQYTSSYH